IRADRALAFAYESTRLYRDEMLLEAQIALERNEVVAAMRLYEAARGVAPRDPEALAGIKICANLKDGTLTRDLIKAEMEKARKGDKIERVGGALRVSKVNMEQIAVQLDKNEDARKGVPLGQDREDLLKAHRDRVIVEEQKLTQIVDTALSQARKELPANPEGTLDFLRNTMARVKDHPDLSDQVRGALVARLETALREAAI